MLPACVQDGPPTLDGGDAGRPAGGVDGAAAHADHVPPAQASPTRASPFRPPPRASLSSTHRLWTQAGDMQALPLFAPSFVWHPLMGHS